MTFLDNKYTRWYFRIIESAKNSAPEKYSEKHHIIPKSIGGSNSNDNLVRLTAKAHFVCHLLLTKMTVGLEKRKMTFALRKMCSKTKRHQRYIPNSTTYAHIRTQFSSEMSAHRKEYLKTRPMIGTANPFYSKKHSAITKNKTAGENHYTKRIDYDPSSHPSKQPGWSEASSVAQKGIPKPLIVCEHCNKNIGGHGNYIRWHGEKCKERII